MIRACSPAEIDQICAVINDAAKAYKGIIPTDCWHEPYMSLAELHHELQAGVNFWGYEDDCAKLVGVMGIQEVQDVTLIRHAYVRTIKGSRGLARSCSRACAA